MAGSFNDWVASAAIHTGAALLAVPSALRLRRAQSCNQGGALWGFPVAYLSNRFGVTDSLRARAR